MPPTPVTTSDRVIRNGKSCHHSLYVVAGRAILLCERQQWDPEEQLFDDKCVSDINLEHQQLAVPGVDVWNTSDYNKVLHTIVEKQCGPDPGGSTEDQDWFRTT